MNLLLAMLFPLITACILLVADVAQQVKAKIALQSAADRAAYAAATTLSDVMNQLAGANWRIHDKFTDTQHTLEQLSTQEDRALADATFKEARDAIDQWRSEMEDQVGAAYQQACTSALSVVKNVVPAARMLPLYGGVRNVSIDGNPTCVGGAALFCFGVECTKEKRDRVETAQWVDVEKAWVKPGPEGGPAEPSVKESDIKELLAYRVKAPRENGKSVQVAFALRLEQPAPPSVFPKLFTDRPIFRAAAAAQPYGGSIKETAFREADSEEAAVQVDPYQPTLVPLHELDNGADGYQGLAYWDDEQGRWESEDAETDYFH